MNRSSIRFFAEDRIDRAAPRIVISIEQLLRRSGLARKPRLQHFEITRFILAAWIAPIAALKSGAGERVTRRPTSKSSPLMIFAAREQTICRTCSASFPVWMFAAMVSRPPMSGCAAITKPVPPGYSYSTTGNRFTATI